MIVEQQMGRFGLLLICWYTSVASGKVRWKQSENDRKLWGGDARGRVRREAGACAWQATPARHLGAFPMTTNVGCCNILPDRFLAVR